ncbi:hypothetical protein INR49_008280 [Caranx melampygus]|nr:hypothetical protein INR49_008280 [Caranx melampygus]
MAMSMRRTLVVLHRATCSSLKSSEVPLDVRQPAPLLLPVRTKKRYFIPPAVGMKGKIERNTEDKSRAAGVVIRQEYFERPINIACTAGIFDAYIPPEGDARLSALSKEGLKQRTEQIRQTAASQLAIRKIKEHDSEFSTKNFAERAQEIFIEAHNALTQFNKEKLHSLVTERCYPEMTRGNRFKTIRWSFIESLEPPKVVHARCPDMVSKGNLYGQVTVRMHSKQVRAEIHGLDFVSPVQVLAPPRQPLRPWRLHGKIVPSWAPAKDPVIKTVMVPGPQLSPGQEFDPSSFEVPKPAAVQWYK